MDMRVFTGMLRNHVVGKFLWSRTEYHFPFHCFPLLAQTNRCGVFDFQGQESDSDNTLALQFLLSNYKDVVSNPVQRAESWLVSCLRRQFITPFRRLANIFGVAPKASREVRGKCLFSFLGENSVLDVLSNIRAPQR